MLTFVRPDSRGRRAAAHIARIAAGTVPAAPVEDIAASFGICVHYVKRIAHEQGIVLPSRSPKKPPRRHPVGRKVVPDCPSRRAAAEVLSTPPGERTTQTLTSAADRHGVSVRRLRQILGSEWQTVSQQDRILAAWDAREPGETKADVARRIGVDAAVFRSAVLKMGRRGGAE